MPTAWVIWILAWWGAALAQERPGVEAPPSSARFAGTEAVVPMDFSAGRPTVQVYLDGMGPYPFVFDTGAPGTVVDADLLQELGVEASGEVQIGDPSGKNQARAKRAVIDSLRLAGVTIAALEVTALPMRGRFQSSFVGVLGFPCFEGSLLELDGPGKVLRVRHGELTAGQGGVVSYRNDHGLIEFDVRVGDRTVPFHLDSGSSAGFTVSPETAAELTWSAPPESVATARTMNNEYTVRRGRMSGTIRFAGLSFENPDVATFELIRGGNIGQAVLRELVLTIDQVNKLLCFRRPGEP